MGSRLGEILVKEGACSDEAVRDALKNQIIFGGRLGTNLLEIQAVSEEALSRALGKQHALPYVYGPQVLDPAAVALVTAEIADRYDAIPMLVKGRRLALIVVDPRNLAMLDEFAFVTGKAVHPVVAPEARIWALLRETYGVDRHLRGIDVDFARLKGRIDVARGVPAATPDPEAAPQGDLMDEGEFSALYAKQAAARPPAALARPPPAAPLPAAAPSPPPPAAAVAGPPPPPDDVIELTELLEPAEAEAWTVPPPPAGPPRVSPEVAAQVLAALDQAPGHAPPARLAVPPPRPAPEPSPLTFAEAVRFLEGVAERDAIARTVLRYARSKFRRAVLLTVHRGVAHGWAGLGEKLGPDAVRHIHLALGQPGILDTVAKAQAHFLGPIPKTESNIRLLKALGGGVPGNALLVPILAMGRVVNLFYVDNGKGGTVDSGDVGELLILATRIAKSYDALLGRVR